MFKSKGQDDNEVDEFTEDILIQCENTININFEKIKEKYKNISKEDAHIICPYTLEAKDENYSPYKIINLNLVSDNRKNGIKNISKYLYIFLKSLRKLERYHPYGSKCL